MIIAMECTLYYIGHVSEMHIWKALAIHPPERDWARTYIVDKSSTIRNIGEGGRSAARDTDRGGLACWDPRPGERFRRDPRNHEYGFSGYDRRSQDALSPLPPYPE